MKYQADSPIEWRGNIPGGGLVEIEIAAGRITAVRPLGPADPDKPFLSPGLVDIQINGYAGVDFSASDLEPDQAASVASTLAKTGVTTFYPTLITNSPEAIIRNLRVLEQARKLGTRFALAAPGYHLEGPYLSPGPAHGAHDPQLMKLPDWEEFSSFQQAAGGRIRMVTVAPELSGALEFIHRARQAGVAVALGHTEGTAGDIHRAAAAGATLNTHLGNGLGQFIDRHKAPFWAQLTDDRLSASLICDGFHLPKELVEVIVRVKGIERLILITDAIHAAGMPPGKYSLVGVPVQFLPTGKIVREDRGSLAGSSVGMNRAVAVFQEYGRVSLQDAIQAATLNPARLLGDAAICAKLAVGQSANLILFRPEPGRLRIESAILGGEFRQVQSEGEEYRR
jgi:N-acetylglucosamine-6-phosphate deacetylase